MRHIKHPKMDDLMLEIAIVSWVWLGPYPYVRMKIRMQTRILAISWELFEGLHSTFDSFISWCTIHCRWILAGSVGCISRCCISAYVSSLHSHALACHPQIQILFNSKTQPSNASTLHLIHEAPQSNLQLCGTAVHQPLGGPTGLFATSDVPARSSGVDLQDATATFPVKKGTSPSRKQVWCQSASEFIKAPLGLRENIAIWKPSGNCWFPTPKFHTQNSFIRPTSLSSTRSNRLSKSFCVSTATRHCAWSLLRVKGSNKYVSLRDPSKYFLGFKNIYDGPYLPKRSKTMFFGSDPLPHTGPTLAGAILPVMVSTRMVVPTSLNMERSGVVILIFLELMYIWNLKIVIHQMTP